MKKLIILSAITFSGLFYNTASAQIRIRLGLHFGPRPVVYVHPAPVVVEQQPVYEQPAPAYDQNAPVYDDQQAPAYDDTNNDYYYLPDVDAYYNVNEQCYYYNDGDNWISAAYLPGEYRDYDWRSARRFEVRAPRPYLHGDFYRSRYNGHQFNDWAHGDFRNHISGGFRGDDHRFDNRGQAFGRGFDNRGNDQRFDNRGGDHRFDNGNRGNDQHFDNGNRGNDQRFNNGGNRGNDQRFNNGGQGNQQHDNHGGFSQPSQNRGNDRGGDQHFASNARGGFGGPRPGRF